MADIGRWSRARGVVGGVIALALIASACGSGSGNSSSTATTAGTAGAGQAGLTDDGTPVQGGQLIVAVTGETDGWSPAANLWADAGNMVGSSMYEPLFTYDADDSLVPWLAESATSNADFTEWKITLRQGITYHDGTEMTAETYAATMTDAIRNGLTSMVIGPLITSIEATGPYEVTITVPVKWASILNTFAGQPGMAYSPAMIDMPERGARNPIGTGAYRFESWTPDSSLKVKAYEDYWGGPCALADPGEAAKKLCEEVGVPLGQKNGPYLDAMEFRPIPDSLQRINALEAGDVNMIEVSSAAGVAELRSGYQVVTDYNTEKAAVVLNTGKAPLDNDHARKALALATDRQAVVDLVADGETLTSDTSPFSADSKWGGFETGYPDHDVAAAQQEVEAYKADTGLSSLDVVVSGVATTDDLAILQLLQEQWGEAGITMTIDTIEQTSFVTNLVAGDFQAAMMRNYNYNDPDSMYFFFSLETSKPPLSVNFSQYASQISEDAVKLGRTTTDFDVRHEAYRQLVVDRNQAVTDVWLYDTPYALVAENNVRGLNPFRVLAWGTYLPKPFLTGLWLET